MSGGWCDTHGGYLGRRCGPCALATPEPADSLVERVRQGFAEAEAMSLPAEDALTELAERAEAAERGRLWLLDRAKAYEAQRDELVEAASKTLHYVDGRAVLKHEPGICPLCDTLAKVRGEA